MQQIDTRKAALLAYTNLENNIEEVPQTDWRRGRNNNTKNLSSDKLINNHEIQQLSPGKFIETTGSKKPEIKDQIRSVK